MKGGPEVTGGSEALECCEEAWRGRRVAVEKGEVERIEGGISKREGGFTWENFCPLH